MLAKKNNKEKKNKDNSKAKLTERIAIAFRKQWLMSSLITMLLVLVIIAAYVALNLWAADTDLPKFDITESKLYTLSEASKKAVKEINKEITIYLYGYDEDAVFVDYAKQYSEVNPNIKVEMLNKDTNMELLSEIGDSYQSTLVVVVSGEKRVFVTPDADFTTSDMSGSTIDITEEKMTNTILSLAEENQPHVYFITGHGEFIPDSESGVLNYFAQFLKDEAFEVDVLNSLSASSIPDDCDILAIISPIQDITEQEANRIVDYVNKGKNLIITKDMMKEKDDMPNLQKVLDLYGVNIDTSGYVLEIADNKYYTDGTNSTPFVFFPDLNTTCEITSDLSNEQTRNPVLLSFMGRIKYKDDTTLSNLNVVKTELATSSEQAAFTTDISSGLEQALATAQKGQSDVGALLEKTITTKTEDGKEEKLESKLVVYSSAVFFSDTACYVNSNYPNIMIGNNKDLILNSMSYLADKEYTLTIRKNTASSTYSYVPNEQQTKIVYTIIFVFPIVIIAIGILVLSYRRVRK